MTNWFQTDAAYDLFSQSGDFDVLRVCSGIWCCQVAVAGAWWCRRGIVQGGVAQKEHYAEMSDSQAETCASDLTALLTEIKTMCGEEHCVYVEIRNFSDYAAYKHVFENQGFLYMPHYDIHLHVSSKGSMLERMHESKQRALKKAFGEGCTWREAETEADIRAFYAILKTLYRTKVKRPLPSLKFFLQAWRSGLTVLITEQNNCITGGVLMPVMTEMSIAYEWYICGGVMSTWAMMEWCSSHGISVIDMMGAGEPNVKYGVRDFKLQMGGVLHEFGRFIWINRHCTYAIGKHIMNLISR